jgi:YHS domain-containing protein
MAIDPVCSMLVDERDPPAIATVAGRTYYFCDLACKQAFLELRIESGVEVSPAQLVDSRGRLLSRQPIPRGVVSILFTDVQNSTQLIHEVGQEAVYRACREAAG